MVFRLVRSMLHAASAPLSFWDSCALNAIDVLNRVLHITSNSTADPGKTAHELLTMTKPSIMEIAPFGCAGYVARPDPQVEDSTLSVRGWRGIDSVRPQFKHHRCLQSLAAEPGSFCRHLRPRDQHKRLPVAERRCLGCTTVDDAALTAADERHHPHLAYYRSEPSSAPLTTVERKARGLLVLGPLQAPRRLVGSP